MLENYPFTHAQKQLLQKIDADLRMWQEGDLHTHFPHEIDAKNLNPKAKANAIFTHYRDLHERLRRMRPDYRRFTFTYKPRRISLQRQPQEKLGLGFCPVASEGTRCCNLYTLDAVQSCGFDCSYCSIQSFYNEDTITFDPTFKEKLKHLSLDPDTIYHIGTGQSSDSLMWGNREGILDALFAFAREHPNVILEFKTKSNNIGYLLEHDIPPNIITTWSLNPQTVIDAEEHLTASLDERIDAAERIAAKGNLVGFHFHPIIAYEGYLEEYGAIYKRLINTFDPDRVAMVSMGTLTFIKSVLKKLRARQLPTKVTQIPMREVNGKFTYDYDTKVEMFRHCYESFRPWHGKVFFYLCMEEHALWRDVFGFEFASNNQFEQMMNLSYMQKIKALP